MKPPNDKVLLAADMVGTLLFAIEGATAAIQGISTCSASSFSPSPRA
jgi:hypothetical protein